MKTKERLLEEIKELESNIETGKKFVALGYPADMLIATSKKLLERAKEQLEELEERR